MDEELRGLERAAAAGDVDAEAQLLLRRVRVGELSEEKLWLAAYLGHGAAKTANPDVPVAPKGLAAWIGGLEPAGPEALARAALAAGWRCLSRYETLLLHQNAGWPLPRACLEAAEDWILCPCDDHRAAAAKAHAAAIDFSGSLTQAIRAPGSQSVNPAHTAAMWAALNVAAIAAGLGGDPESASSAAEHAAEAACSEHAGGSHLPFARTALRQAIGAELLDFALGIRDQPAATQEARRRAQAMGESPPGNPPPRPTDWSRELARALDQGLPGRGPLNSGPRPLMRFAMGLAHFRTQVWVRVMLATAHVCSPLLSQGTRPAGAAAYEDLQIAARTWALCPCDTHQAECRALAKAPRQPDDSRLVRSATLDDLSWVAATLAGHELKTLGGDPWRERSTSFFGEYLVLAGDVVGELRLHRALACELGAWAQGESDPVRARARDKA